MKYVLIVFVASLSGQGVIPQIVEQPYDTQLACWNAGYSFKARESKQIVWWNCERLPSNAFNDEAE